MRALTRVLLCLMVVASAGVPIAQPLDEAVPIFSFCRNINLRNQVNIPLEYSRDFSPLPPEMAERCCAVRPGDITKLIQRGRIVGSGVINSIVAAEIPHSAIGKMVFFATTIFADSTEHFFGLPPFPRSDARDYDLYVIGDLEVTSFEPAETLWSQSKDVTEIVEEALASRVIRKADVRYLAEETARLSGREISRSVQPDTLVFTLRAECELIEYSIMDEGYGLVVHSCQRSSSRWGPYFVRISSPRFDAPVFIRGELDYFLRVEGVPYMVLRDVLFGTGAWGYHIFKLSHDESPLEVHRDGSWST